MDPESPSHEKTSVNTSYYEAAPPYQEGSVVAVGVTPPQHQHDETAGLVEHEHSADPHDLSNPGKPTTNLGTLMNLIKGNVGIGILAMPSAIANAGLIGGTVGILVLGFLATYCMKQLVDVSAYLAQKNTNLKHLNYPDTCGEAIKIGPQWIRRYSYAFRLMVNIFIVTAQMMGCTAYLLFISQSIQQLVSTLTGFQMSIQIWEAIVLAALLPYIQVRYLQLLSIFTTVANVCVLICLLIVFQFVIRDRTIAVENLPLFGDISHIPLAFGTIIFAFEGINLVMPLRNKMREPEAFDGWSGVLMLGMTIVAVLYAIMGFFGYLKIGDDFTGVLTNYVIPLIKTDPLGWLYAICIVMVIIQIYISYGLQLYVAVICMFPPIAAHYKLSATKAFWAETAFRCFLAVVTFGIGAAVPCLGDIFSLVGAFTGSALSILIPAFIDLIVFAPVHQQNNDKNKLVFLMVKNIVILVVGFAGFFIGTYTAIQQIVNDLSSHNC